MNYKHRINLYKSLEKIRKTPLIVYVTSGRQGAGGQISGDAVREFSIQLLKLPKDTKNVDILINSQGGDGLSSWRIITMIKEYIGASGKITCFVPHYAFSAATLMAVGCNEIYMHPLANLGPVDPQMVVRKKDGGTQQFAYEDVSAYTNFLKEEAGITEQKEKVNLLTPLVSQIDPSVIGASKRASMQSIIMAEKLLKLHMQGINSQKAEIIAEKLSKNYFSHGHAVSRTEARELGLKIVKNTLDIDNIIWKIYESFETEMKMNERFDPTMIYLSEPSSASLLQPPANINMPVNVPPQLAQQYWTSFFQTLIPTPNPSIDFELIHAAIESIGLSKKFVTRGKIFGYRQPDLNYRIAAPQTSAKWE